MLINNPHDVGPEHRNLDDLEIEYTRLDDKTGIYLTQELKREREAGDIFFENMVEAQSARELLAGEILQLLGNKDLEMVVKYCREEMEKASAAYIER